LPAVLLAGRPRRTIALLAGSALECRHGKCEVCCSCVGAAASFGYSGLGVVGGLHR